MRMISGPLVLAFAALGGASSAQTVADELGLPSRFQDWIVKTQTQEDQPVCVATVEDEDRAISVYGTITEGVFIRFYDRDWQLDPQKVDVKVRVDRRAEWTIKGARRRTNLYDIALPEDDAVRTFLENLKGGNWIYLYASSGFEMGIWSLSGSRGALDTWQRCVDLLR